MLVNVYVPDRYCKILIFRSSQQAKLRCVLNYFEKVADRRFEIQGSVTFVRQVNNYFYVYQNIHLYFQHVQYMIIIGFNIYNNVISFDQFFLAEKVLVHVINHFLNQRTVLAHLAQSVSHPNLGMCQAL